MYVHVCCCTNFLASSPRASPYKSTLTTVYVCSCEAVYSLTCILSCSRRSLCTDHLHVCMMCRGDGMYMVLIIIVGVLVVLVGSNI